MKQNCKFFLLQNVHYGPNINRSFVEITADLFDSVSCLNLCIKLNMLQGVQIFGQTIFWMFKDEINIEPSMLSRQTSTMYVFYTVGVASGISVWVRMSALRLRGGLTTFGLEVGCLPIFTVTG